MGSTKVNELEVLKSMRKFSLLSVTFFPAFLCSWTVVVVSGVDKNISSVLFSIIILVLWALSAFLFGSLVSRSETLRDLFSGVLQAAEDEKVLATFFIVFIWLKLVVYPRGIDAIWQTLISYLLFALFCFILLRACKRSVGEDS